MDERLQNLMKVASAGMKIEAFPLTKDWKELFFFLKKEDGTVLEIAKCYYSQTQNTITNIKAATGIEAEIKEQVIADNPAMLKAVKAAGFALYGID